MELKAGRKRAKVTTWAEASQRYCEWRGVGPSMRRMRDGEILDESGFVVATVSHNGKVWSPGPWHSGKAPLYTPEAQ